MTTPPKDTTERDELAKLLFVMFVVKQVPDGQTAFRDLVQHTDELADAYMAEKERRNG